MSHILLTILSTEIILLQAGKKDVVPKTNFNKYVLFSFFNSGNQMWRK